MVGQISFITLLFLLQQNLRIADEVHRIERRVKAAQENGVGGATVHLLYRFNGVHTEFATAQTDPDGYYSVSFPTGVVENGVYEFKAAF